MPSRKKRARCPHCEGTGYLDAGNGREDIELEQPEGNGTFARHSRNNGAPMGTLQPEPAELAAQMGTGPRQMTTSTPAAVPNSYAIMAHRPGGPQQSPVAYQQPSPYLPPTMGNNNMYGGVIGNSGYGNEQLPLSATRGNGMGNMMGQSPPGWWYANNQMGEVSHSFIPIINQISPQHRVWFQPGMRKICRNLILRE